jgi:hypothetical protein
LTGAPRRVGPSRPGRCRRVPQSLQHACLRRPNRLRRGRPVGHLDRRAALRIIADKCLLRGTFRTGSAQIRERISRRIARLLQPSLSLRRRGRTRGDDWRAAGGQPSKPSAVKVG